MANLNASVPPLATPNRPPAAERAAPGPKAGAPPATTEPEPELPVLNDRRSVLPLLTDERMAEAEKSVANVAKLRQLALSVTGPNDWVDVGGKPYLSNSGTMKVAALFGVSLTGMRVEAFRETIGEKEVVRYVARTTARFLGREVEVEGVGSSDESFFAKRDGAALPLSEVNLNAVRKKAVTNAQNRAVKAILGLGGLTWDAVRRAGVEKGRIPAVEYSQPKAGERNERPAARAPAPRAPAKRRLKNMLVDVAAFESVPFERALRRYTEFRGEDGKPVYAESIDTMSEAWAAKALQRVEADWRAIPMKLKPGLVAAAFRSAEVEKEVKA
jgi:hypothetical protein